MDRYSLITNKNAREIVLLKSYPCKWGRCAFCDYIDDNTSSLEDMLETNREVLKNITGEFGQLEVINSASVFELPDETLEEIKKIVVDKKIHTIYFEAYYNYKDRLDEIRSLFKGIKVVFKCGIETFDDYIRNKILKKGIVFKDALEVAEHFKSICLLVGFEGQTKESIMYDMKMLMRYFERGCINIYINNTTPIKRNEELIKWFKDEYGYLDQYENIEILWNNTDFGVGD
ncbi:MAG: radical SAM protein [Tissierellia bacterium]|nr:radical SAM protein [Tissierellia bacterium]